jgi:hypothetical protein
MQNRQACERRRLLVQTPPPLPFEYAMLFMLVFKPNQMHHQVHCADSLQKALNHYKQRVACVICPFGLSIKLQEEVKKEAAERGDVEDNV